MIYFTRGLGFQKRMRNYLYKGNSARIYRLFKFYQTAITIKVQKTAHLTNFYEAYLIDFYIVIQKFELIILHEYQ